MKRFDLALASALTLLGVFVTREALATRALSDAERNASFGTARVDTAAALSDSAPVAPRLYAQTVESWKAAEFTDPVDSARIAQLQNAFDRGASRAELVELARRLNLEFNRGDYGELIAAIAYRDEGGKGAMITGSGFNPYSRK